MKLKMMVLTGVFLTGFAGFGFAVEGRHAIILKSEGIVEYRLGQEEWKKAETGVVLPESAEIRTGKKGVAKLLLDEGGKTGEFELNPESRLKLNTLDLDEKTGDKTTILDLAVGSVMVHAEKLQGASKFQVRTANSTTGVRGTRFLVTAAPKKGNASQK